MSGLVVNILIFLVYFEISKKRSQPKDFPIQFFCIIFTFSGQPSKLFKSFKSGSEYLEILKNH